MATKSEIEQLIKRLSKTERVLFGTFSGIVATVIVHPLDVIKVRLQVHEKSYNTRTMARLILRCEGAAALYAGLTAGLLRQATNTTTRLVVYHTLNQQVKRIVREDGILTLWRGGTLTMARSILLSVAQIGVYAEVNANVGKRKILEGNALHVFTSVMSSFVTSILSLPVDLIKSRYQVRRDSVTQGEILKCILRKKGILYFWKGLGPYFIRILIHTITTLMIFEKITEILYYEKKDR